jgi:hypothetical protein
MHKRWGCGLGKRGVDKEGNTCDSSIGRAEDCRQLFCLIDDTPQVAGSIPARKSIIKIKNMQCVQRLKKYSYGILERNLHMV